MNGSLGSPGKVGIDGKGGIHGKEGIGILYPVVKVV